MKHFTFVTLGDIIAFKGTKWEDPTQKFNMKYGNIRTFVCAEYRLELICAYVLQAKTSLNNEIHTPGRKYRKFFGICNEKSQCTHLIVSLRF